MLSCPRGSWDGQPSGLTFRRSSLMLGAGTKSTVVTGRKQVRLRPARDSDDISASTPFTAILRPRSCVMVSLSRRRKRSASAASSIGPASRRRRSPIACGKRVLRCPMSNMSRQSGQPGQSLQEARLFGDQASGPGLVARPAQESPGARRHSRICWRRAFPASASRRKCIRSNIIWRILSSAFHVSPFEEAVVFGRRLRRFLQRGLGRRARARTSPSTDGYISRIRSASSTRR